MLHTDLSLKCQGRVEVSLQTMRTQLLSGFSISTLIWTCPPMRAAAVTPADMGCTPSKSAVIYSQDRVCRDLDTCSTFVPSLRRSVPTPQRPRLCVETGSKQTFLHGEFTGSLNHFVLRTVMWIPPCVPQSPAEMSTDGQWASPLTLNRGAPQAAPRHAARLRTRTTPEAAGPRNRLQSAALETRFIFTLQVIYLLCAQ